MANEIKIDLTLTGEQSTARGLKNVGDAAEKAGDDLVSLGKDAGYLDQRLGDLRAEVKGLVADLDKTGDTALLKQIRAANREIGQLERLKKQMASFDGPTITKQLAEVGSEVGGAVRKGFVKSLSEMGGDLRGALHAAKGPAIAGAVVLGLAVAPFLSGVIASAVIGGAGVGGIIGGIVAASQDQRVQEEAKRVGLRIASSLTDAGTPFVEPLIESLHLLDAASDRLAANFEEVGKKIAPVMVPLTKGLTGFVDEFMPGFVRAMDAAKPVIRSLANELPKIGGALSDFFDTLSEDPDGAIMAVTALSQIIQGTLGFAGGLISTLSQMFEMTQKWGASATDAVAGLAEKLQYIAPIWSLIGHVAGTARDNYEEQIDSLNRAKDASGDFAGDGGLGSIIRAQEEVKKVTKTATDAIEDQIKAMDKMFGRFMDSRDVARNYQEAIDELTESVVKNGSAFDFDSEAGRQNSQMLDNLAKAIRETRDNTVLMTGDVDSANTVFYQQVEAARRQAIALGMSKQAADAWAAALRDIPRQVDVEVRAPGLLEALARAQALNRLLGGAAAASRTRPITINGQFYPGDDSGFGGGRAGGGPMAPGKWYTVGENGVEVVSMHPGGGATVFNDKQTAAMMSGASGGSAMAMGAPQVNLNVQVERSGDRLTDVLMQALAYELRFTGGVIGEYRIPRA